MMYRFAAPPQVRRKSIPAEAVTSENEMLTADLEPATTDCECAVRRCGTECCGDWAPHQEAPIRHRMPIHLMACLQGDAVTDLGPRPCLPIGVELFSIPKTAAALSVPPP